MNGTHLKIYQGDYAYVYIEIHSCIYICAFITNLIFSVQLGVVFFRLGKQHDSQDGPKIPKCTVIIAYFLSLSHSFSLLTLHDFSLSWDMESSFILIKMC